MDQTGNKLVIVVGGGTAHRARGLLESHLKDILPQDQEQGSCHLFIVKSMMDAAGMLMMYMKTNEGEPAAFYNSVLVVIVRNQALEFVNNQWARVHYTSLHDHTPYPVVADARAGVSATSINFYTGGENDYDAYVWQALFPQWRQTQDVNPLVWLTELSRRTDKISIQEVQRPDEISQL